MSFRRVRIPPQLVMLVFFGGASVLNYAFGLVMGWLLLPGDFGWLAFAQTILLVGGLVLQSGFPWSLARSIVDVTELESDTLVRGALVANLALAAAMAIAIMILFALGPLRPGLETGAATAIVALALPFISLATIVRGAAQGSERFGVIAAVGITEILCKVVIATVLVLTGFGAIGAIAGFLIGAIMAAALGIYYLIFKLDVRLWGSIKLPTLRIAGPMFGALLGLSLLLNLDLGALKLLSGERTLAGYYQAGLVLANAPYYLVMSTIVPVLFVQLARFRSIPMTREVVGETLGITVALVIPIEFVLIVFPETALVTLFPDSYALGAPALRLLAVGNAMLILVAIISAAFQAIGRAKVPALLLPPIILLESVALWVAVPAWEAVGAASAFVAASSAALFLLSIVYLYQLGVEAVWQAASWLFRYLLAAGAGVLMGGVAFGIAGNPNLAVAVGGVCYLAAVFPLRLIRKPVISDKRGLSKNIVDPIEG